MTLDQIANLLDKWEARWPAEKRSWRAARADLVTMVLAATGNRITDEAIYPLVAPSHYINLPEFLRKWDDVFAARRVDFIIDLTTLLAHESMVLAEKFMEKLREKAGS